MRSPPRDAAGENTKSIVEGGASSTAAARVVVMWDGGATVSELPARGVVTVGRGAECEVRVDHGSVSRAHARLHVGGETCIEDLGSSNGTRVRGRRIERGERVPLRAGESVELGATVLVLHAGGPAAADQAPSSRHVAPPTGGKMERVHEWVDRVAAGDINVLILGETGVGKDVLAARIHACSPRRAGPFLRLNCAALPEPLLESELFGHERGAFTGAVQAKRGLFESAEGGSVLLDEIGELPLTTQSKLLLALENREVLRVGSVKPRAIDVRFIAATNRNLEGLVQAGTFRADLFYRLSGAAITIPGLRERRGEIRALALHFLEEVSARLGRPSLSISPAAMSRLEAHAWPGNVRELRNAVEQAALLCVGSVLEPAHLTFVDAGLASSATIPPSAPATTPRPDGAPKAPPAPAAAPSPPRPDLHDEVIELERQRILEALEQCGGNQTRAAHQLGISRRTLLNRLDDYGVPRPRKRTSDP